MRVGIVYFTEDRVEQETEKIHFSALLGFFNFFPSLGDLSSGALSNHAIGLERGGRQGWDIEEHEKSLGRLHD